jgi:hypothetical protein
LGVDRLRAIEDEISKFRVYDQVGLRDLPTAKAVCSLLSDDSLQDLIESKNPDDIWMHLSPAAKKRLAELVV